MNVSDSQPKTAEITEIPADQIDPRLAEPWAPQPGARSRQVIRR
jgi:hypothetical protein